MPITVRVMSASRSLLDGRDEAAADGATVREVMAQLGLLDEICDAKGNLRRHLNLNINDSQDIRFHQGLDTLVEDGDVVTVLAALSGG